MLAVSKCFQYVLPYSVTSFPVKISILNKFPIKKHKYKKMQKSKTKITNVKITFCYDVVTESNYKSEEDEVSQMLNLHKMQHCLVHLSPYIHRIK